MIKIKYTLLLILAFLFSITVNAQMVESSAYNIMLKTLLSRNVKEISVDSAAQLKNVVFVDAREKKEFRTSHIKDAIFVGYDNQNLTPLKNIDKSSTLIVYCSVGYRSEKTTQKLNQLGFSNVYNLYGGIFEWKNQGYPIFIEDEETEKIHAYSKTWGIWLKKGEKVYD